MATAYPPSHPLANIINKIITDGRAMQSASVLARMQPPPPHTNTEREHACVTTPSPVGGIYRALLVFYMFYLGNTCFYMEREARCIPENLVFIGIT